MNTFFRQLIWVVPLILIVSAQRAETQPRIEIAGGDTVNWGNVAPGTLRRDIRITNRGTETLTIADIRPSCGCTTAPVDKNSLAPGDTATIQLSVTLNHKDGLQRKLLWITSDDPDRPEVTMLLQAFVIQDIIITPPLFPILGNVAVQKESSTSIRLINAGQEPITLDAPLFHGDSAMGVRLFPSEESRMRPGDTVVLVAHVRPERAGALFGEVVVRSSSSRTPELRIKLYCQAADRVSRKE